MLTRDRFKPLTAMLHIVDFSKESKEDKLKKVQHFIDHMCQRCKELYQPSVNVVNGKIKAQIWLATIHAPETCEVCTKVIGISR